MITPDPIDIITQQEGLLAKLFGEAGVMKALLSEALTVIETVCPETDIEGELLMALRNRMYYAIRGATS